jgi:sulfur-oxidizing protein SoxA
MLSGIPQYKRGGPTASKRIVARRISTRVSAIVDVLCVAALLASGAAADEIRSFVSRPDLPRASVKSGYTFLTDETKALQDDPFANPGYLWVDRGERAFAEQVGSASCQSCHAPEGERALAGAAARYPGIDRASSALVNLEGRINLCRTRHQGLEPLPYESEPLLALTAYIADLSRQRPYDVAVDGPAARYFTQGRDYFFTRRGQLNLACNQCHDDNFGKMLRGDRLSQGQPTAFPAYRLEWQALGSLHRRIRDCDAGVRAEPYALGSETYVALELYLAWRAGDLPIESPGVRR